MDFNDALRIARKTATTKQTGRERLAKINQGWTDNGTGGFTAPSLGGNGEAWKYEHSEDANGNKSLLARYNGNTYQKYQPGMSAEDQETTYQTKLKELRAGVNVPFIGTVGGNDFYKPGAEGAKQLRADITAQGQEKWLTMGGPGNTTARSMLGGSPTTPKNQDSITILNNSEPPPQSSGFSGSLTKPKNGDYTTIINGDKIRYVSESGGDQNSQQLGGSPKETSSLAQKIASVSNLGQQKLSGVVTPPPRIDPTIDGLIQDVNQPAAKQRPRLPLTSENDAAGGTGTAGSIAMQNKIRKGAINFAKGEANRFISPYRDLLSKLAKPTGPVSLAARQAAKKKRLALSQ